MDPKAPVLEAHAVSTRLQMALHAGAPDISRVIVHMEPFRDDNAQRAMPEGNSRF
jgi:divalent metal cation (Fe/Co/Zn/Cd) transporter